MCNKVVDKISMTTAKKNEQLIPKATCFSFSEFVFILYFSKPICLLVDYVVLDLWL